MAKRQVITVSRDTARLDVLPAGSSVREYRVGRGAHLSLMLTSVSTRKSEAQVTVRLAGVGARATITGVLVKKGDTSVTLHTMQIHEAAGTTSDLLIKTVLSGHARSLYDGGIRVEKKAQQTNAYQRNENLLLTGRAYAESKPSLEILANDVRCTHGATTGPIDDDALWYLSTRGVSKSKAERLIVEGFILSALARIDDSSLRLAAQKQLTNAV